MTPERWQQIKRIIADALDLDISDRPDFLRQACGGDDTLFDEASAILASQEKRPVLLQLFDTPPKRPAPLAPGDSLLDGRFLLLEFLGRGSVGTVHRALDRNRDEQVALKVLHLKEPDLVARFKNEFRSLQSLRHTNLVRLDELFETEDICFFSMELIEGVNFLEYVRTSAPSGAAFNPNRLLPSLLQLCDGISALHKAGKLHRDIKPANVLVDPTGRVVLLDFSVVREIAARAERQTFVGTPPYMAPEQAQQLQTVSEPADWFALGVMLYDALTGLPPFDGQYWRWVPDESKVRLIDPRALKPAIPNDLADLCVELLARAPKNRPVADDIFRRLQTAGGTLLPSPPEPSRELFVGRGRELTKLHELFERTLAGQAAIASLFGRSGMGKTTLVQKFISELSRQYPNAVILTGRCHQSETVPFKALDEVMGRLSRMLNNLPNSEVEAVLSRDVHLVARLFPALIQVPAIAVSGHRRIDVPDSQEFRKRAFMSLLELLGRLSSRTPLVIAIDDLQWGDLDSAVFFGEFVSSVSPANLLLIASYRSEDLESSPFLKESRRHLSTANPQIVIERIEIGELPPQESTTLAISLLAETVAGSDLPAETAAGSGQAMIIAQESLGSPFLIEQFARYVFDRRNHSPSAEAAQNHTFDLREVIEARIASLPDAARRLLRIVSIAGQPISERVAKAAAGLSSEYFVALKRLCAEPLLRELAAPGGREVEIYHDKVRQILNASLAAGESKELHRQMAVALQQIEPEDASVLARHFLKAEMYDEAVRFTIEAADRASGSLAFARAAQLYREALDLGLLDKSMVFELRKKLGYVLVASGRGVEAAEAFTASADTQDSPSKRIECLRLAADQYLRSGHIKEGIAILRILATSVGIRITEDRWRVASLFLLRKAHIRLRGLRYRERPERDIPREELMRLDVYWSLVVGFGMVDPLLGMTFHAKHLLLALKTGEPYRIGLSLALEAGFSSLQGEEQYSRAQEILRQCKASGLRLNSPHLLGLTSAMGATCAHLTHRLRDAKRLGKHAEEILKSQCTGVAWELATARTFYFSALGWLGDWKELSEEFPGVLRDARERNDLHTVTQLILTAPSTWANVAADRHEAAYEDIDVAISNWSKETQRSFDVPHFLGILQLSALLLYSSRGAQAWALINRNWLRIRRFQLMLRSEFLALTAYQTRGQTALGAAAETSGEERRILLAEAEKCATKIDRRKTTWASPFAELIRASILAMRGRQGESLHRLATAEAEFEYGEFRMYAAATSYCRGLLTGGQAGRDLQDAAEAFMKSQSVVNPQRVVQMLAPGEWR
jgi:serine/threonine protein kinase